MYNKGNILKHYTEFETLNAHLRKELAQTLSSYFIDKKFKLNRHDFEFVNSLIHEEFEKENLVSFIVRIKIGNRIYPFLQRTTSIVNHTVKKLIQVENFIPDTTIKLLR